MEKIRQTCMKIRSARRLPALIIILSLAILGGVIILGRQQLRHQLRDQIVSREGEILTAVALMEQYADENEIGVLGPIDDPATQFEILLKASRLKGVIATRLFDADGNFVNALPLDVTEVELLEGDLAQLKNLKPKSHFHPNARLSDVFMLMVETAGQSPVVPLLEVNIPIYPKDNHQLAGVAQFIIDGKSIADEFAALDGHLSRQALSAFLAGGIIMLASLGWAFRRLDRANRLLSERTVSLLRANQELSLAAKTTAVGAVTAHLMHGLQNPLSGLQSFVNSRAAAPDPQAELDWQDVIATTRRMQTMVSEIVRVLREENGVSKYEIALDELGQLVLDRMQPASQEANVRFEVRCVADGVLTNRDGNLIMLIIENLVKNAIQASPANKTVKLDIFAAPEGTVFEVQDQGPGIPEESLPKLFVPCRSAKPDGSGIGLALSKQLAIRLGADLVLKSNSPVGCVFALTVLPTSGRGSSDKVQEII